MSKFEQTEIITIWDVDELPKLEKKNIIYWRLYSTDSNIVSIPFFIEKNKHELRSIITSWVHDVGQIVIGEKTIVGNLEIREDFSFWWLTEFSEMQHFGKSPQLYDAVRFLAFEKWINSKEFSKLEFITNREDSIINTLENWCKNRGIEFSVIKNKKSINKEIKIFKYIPDSLLAFLFLLKNLKFENSFFKYTVNENVGNVFIQDYLLLSKNDENIIENYISNYWTSLIKNLNDRNLKLNLLLFWVPLSGKKSIDRLGVNKVIKKFNITSTKNNHHLFDTKISTQQLFVIISNYFKLNKALNRISKFDKIFRVNNSNFDFKFLFYPALKTSLKGIDAVKCLIYLIKFEDYFKKIPKQIFGLYLQENLCWENSLIYAWKKNGHGNIIGVPHVSIRQWDLRYYVDQRSYNLKHFKRPKPDIIALNAKDSIEAYFKQNYPKSEIFEVEALRFLYLNNTKINKLKSDKIRILVLGDYLLENTINQLTLLENAIGGNISKYIIYYKSHPVCSVNLNKLLKIEIIEVNDTWEKLFSNCDFVYTSNVTTAAIDAYSVGLKVITLVNGNSFNMSPLINYKEVIFVTNSDEFRDAIEKNNSSNTDLPKSYFNINSSLTLWNNLITKVSE